MTFFELIQSQTELLRRLLQVSQQQLEVVERGDPVVLVQYLEHRGRLWGEFELLQQQLEPHKGIPPEQRVWNNAQEREITESAVQQCTKLLQEILAYDQVSLSKGEELKEKVAKDLRRVQLSKNAAPAYIRQSQMVR